LAADRRGETDGIGSIGSVTVALAAWEVAARTTPTRPTKAAMAHPPVSRVLGSYGWSCLAEDSITP
jgi:hypothetical protein